MSTIKQQVINNEIISGILLLVCAVLALIINNSSLSEWYNSFLNIKVAITIDGIGINKPLLLWINDGLMAVFFLLVGLELKREVAAGELSSPSKVILPIVGAIGGMLFPIIIYYYFNQDNPEYMVGWAIPMATDIAFALGILALFGKRVSIQLKLFLLTLAIIDDLGAILVIGIYHTKSISWHALGFALVATIVLILLNWRDVKRTSLYGAFGLLLWFSTLQSGFHATIAGVVLALTIPVVTKDGSQVLHNLEENLKPLVSFFILPVFAFSNSGIPLVDISMNDLLHPLVIGTAVGLILGNLLGISILTLIVKRIFNIHTSYTTTNLIGTALLCGIGFTMSLFISGLSFSNDVHLLNLSRLGILSGSFMSMILGSIVLHLSLPKQ